MGYPTSNAAFAYDMQPEPVSPASTWAPAVPAPAARPRFDVVTGAGREADQVTSPIFTHCIKVFCILAILFLTVGLARVVITGFTAASLNASASLSDKLEAAQDASSDLEVAHSVYGASTRIRDLAMGYGMANAEENIVLDFTERVPAASSSDAAATGTGTVTSAGETGSTDTGANAAGDVAANSAAAPAAANVPSGTQSSAAQAQAGATPAQQ